MTSELVEKQGTLKDLVKSDAFKEAVQGFFAVEANRKRFVQSAVNCLTKVSKLAQCDKMSFFGSLMQLASFGLEPNGRDAHLIPYGTTCTLIIDYKGLVTLAYRNSKILDVHADAVYSKDVFRKVNGHYVHEVDSPFGDRGDVVGYYAVARLQGGGIVDDAMSVKDVDRIRARSRASQSGPWATDYDEMAKKTVFKRLSKWLPVTPELQAAIAKDDERYEQPDVQTSRAARVTAGELLGGGEPKDDVIDVPPDGEKNPEDVV